METLETIEMLINNENEEGVFAISDVSTPAMESSFIALAKELEYIKLEALDTEKRLLVGVVMIPNKLIFRKNFMGRKEVNIFFTSETIEKASQLFMEDGFQNNSTLEHNGKATGNVVVESWIKVDLVHDKSVKYGIDAPIGSWIVARKIHDDETWEKAKKGEITGFSLEGLFTEPKKTKLSKIESELLIEVENILKH